MSELDPNTPVSPSASMKAVADEAVAAHVRTHHPRLDAPVASPHHAGALPQAASPARKKKSSLVRTIGPAIPLAIPLAMGLLHGTATGNATPAPGTIASAPSATQSGTGCGAVDSTACVAPMPLLAAGHPVDWFFVFKLHTKEFPMCGTPEGAGSDTRTCLFDQSLTPPDYTKAGGFSQRYVVASSDSAELTGGGSECLGESTNDPVGATFGEVFNGNYHYVIWNDQPYADPSLNCPGNECGEPWGHSKGMLAWNDAGQGFVMQVSTPSWPLTGNPSFPRKLQGNTLGCVKDDDVLVSQHFFALRLTKDDLVAVLQGMANASVVTDPTNKQVVSNGGPSDVVALVNTLGKVSTSTTVAGGPLSSGVRLISKPSKMHVPPWQFVSAELGGLPLRVANWWVPKDVINSTTAATPVTCWNDSLAKPGAVDIAISGTWKGTPFGLKGGDEPEGNHAKFGVTTSGSTPFSIFGDMNQEGALTGSSADCAKSQNPRGGMFFVMNNPTLWQSLTGLLTGDSAPVQ